ncbi:MAG TPA: ribosome biogenesis GTPase Der, partial [Ktedonobacterales bacterium]
MKPLVAIVGRPNVGKSTLFNRLVGERLAIVEDLPGTTRDRLYADAEWNGRIFSLVDTGGLELGTSEDITARIAAQAQLAIEEADVIVLLVDTKSGITEADAEVANILRRSGKPVVLGANKADNLTRRQEAVEFYSLGLGEPITLAANSGSGTGDLLDAITEHLPPAEEEDEAPSDGIPRLAIVGRPNVGKSSLLNAIAGSDRVIVSDIPGTTRDAIDTEVEYKGRRIMLIDTAGIRRRGHIGPGVEKYSVLRADRAIDRCDVAVLMIDAVEGITAQDTHIAGYINEAAKGIVAVINKWDIIKERRRQAEEWADPDVPILPSENVDLAALEVRDAEVAEMLRRSGKPVVLGANKADNLTRRQEAVEFYSLGLGEPITLAANSGTGTGDLLDAITEHLPPAEEEDEVAPDGIPRLAIVGRPNVGKSSLLNAIAGSDRVIVSDIPGTTRDAIDTEVEYKGRRIMLIDTAG